MSNTPIDARLTFSRNWLRPPLGLYHRRFRGFAATMHHHDEAQLLIPLNGRMHMVAGGRAHMLGPDTAVWLPPGIPHSFVHVDGQLEFLAVEVEPGAAGDQLPPVAAGWDRPLVARSAGLRHLAQAMAVELDAPAEGVDRVLRSCLDTLFLYLERALAPTAAPEEAASSEVSLVIEAILAGYADELRVPDLAAMVGLSPRQLERRFLKEVGRTPKRFIVEVRVGAAESLLRNSDRPVSQIAMDVGFQTPSHFTDTFKAMTGRTPQAARSLSET